MYGASVTMGWLATVYCLCGKNRRERVLIPMGLRVLVVLTPMSRCNFQADVSLGAFRVFSTPANVT